MHLQLLGPIEARLDDRPLQLGAPKQRALLAMLALHVNRAVSTDRLAEGLWGEEPPASAAKMVQLYVSQLRRALDGDGAAIVTHGRGYELRLEPDRVDAARFERLVDARQPRAALALWRGDGSRTSPTSRSPRRRSAGWRSSGCMRTSSPSRRISPPGVTPLCSASSTGWSPSTR